MKINKNGNSASFFTEFNKTFFNDFNSALFKRFSTQNTDKTLRKNVEVGNTDFFF